MRHRLALLGATIAVSVPVGIVATTSASAATYPSSAKKVFQKACVKSAKKQGASSKQAATVCKGSLKCIEKKLTLGQFKAYGVAVAKGDKSPPHEAVIVRCVKQAAKAA